MEIHDLYGCFDFMHHAKECGCGDERHIERKHVVIVVSPLIALMKDQVCDLKENNVVAVYAGETTADEGG